jgi:hypothetical protein
VGPLRLAAILLVLAVAPAARAAPLGSQRAPQPTNPFVAMEVTGGFAGIESYLGVGARGLARLDNRSGSRYFHLRRRELKRLKDAVRKAGWSKLRSSYPASQPVADGFHYALLHRGQVVRTEDGARRPKRLERVIGLLEKIAARRGGFN